MHYLHYFDPNIQKELYAGIGPATYVVFLNREKPIVGIGPELLFGKQHMTDSGKPRHWQISAGFPFVREFMDFEVYPVVTGSYSWGF